MEILIVVAIMAVVTKRGVEDILHTARGGTPHRYTAAKQRRQTGAAGRYWATLWEDTWTDMAAKHAERRDRRRSGSSPEPTAKVGKPRGAATQFFAGLAQDGRRAARRSWEDGWTRLDERRRTKATRPRPGQVTVPGTVVPNAQDESQDEEVRPHQDRPQDEDDFMCLSCGTRPALPRSLWCSSCGPRPQDEDSPVPADDGRTDLQFGDDPTDPTGTKTCPECRGTSITQDGICLACRDRQEQRNQHYEDGTRDTWKVVLPNGNTIVTDHPEVYQNRGYPTEKVRGRDHQQGFLVTDRPATAVKDCRNCDGWPNITMGSLRHTHDEFCQATDILFAEPDNQTNSPLTTTQEGTTMTTTIPTDVEVIGLDPAIGYCDYTVQACKAMIHSLERTEAAIAAGGVTGVAAVAFSQAREKFGEIATIMEGAGQEFVAHKGIQERYDANPGAGSKEFITAGR